MGSMGTNDSNETALQPSESDGLEDFIPKPLVASSGQPPESKLGARVQTARNHFGLSVDALSRLTKATDVHESRGVSSTALLRYEAGEALPGARELRLLCDSLGVSADWLLTGNLAAGLDPAEHELLAALWRVNQFHSRQAAVGDGVALMPAYIEKMQRRQRIVEAKRRS